MVTIGLLARVIAPGFPTHVMQHRGEFMNHTLPNQINGSPHGMRRSLWWLAPTLLFLALVGSCKRAGTGYLVSRETTFPLKDLMILRKRDGIFVGTPNNLSWRKLPFGSDWALSSDHRYLAAGIDVLDTQTGTWAEIPVEVPEGATNIILRWAPHKPVLALAFEPPYAMFTIPPKDRSKYGSPLFLWDMAEKKLTRYDEIRVDENLWWLKEGEQIVYTQGAARSNPNHEAFDYSGYVFTFRTKAETRRDRPLAKGEWKVPDGIFAEGVLDKINFDLHGGLSDGLGHYWMSDSSCENPRTGDTVKTFDRPTRLEIKRKGDSSWSKVADLPCGFFHVSFGLDLTWKPRWLSDDRDVVMHGDSDKLLAVDVVRGSVDELARDVIEFDLIDPDLYEMRRDRMLREFAPDGKIDMELFNGVEVP